MLVTAAVVFFAALFCIYSKDIRNGAGDVFTSSGDELVEFEKATVIEILSEDLKADEVAEGAYKGTQELKTIVKSGRYKNEEMVVYNYIGPLSGVPVSEGDSVTSTIKTQPTGDHSATVYEFNRIPILAAFLVLFFVVIILVGGRTGLKSLIGLIITVVCLFAILIPLLLRGAPISLKGLLVAGIIISALGGGYGCCDEYFLGFGGSPRSKSDALKKGTLPIRHEYRTRHGRHNDKHIDTSISRQRVYADYIPVFAWTVVLSSVFNSFCRFGNNQRSFCQHWNDFGNSTDCLDFCGIDSKQQEISGIIKQLLLNHPRRVWYEKETDDFARHHYCYRMHRTYRMRRK